MHCQACSWSFGAPERIAAAGRHVLSLFDESRIVLVEGDAVFVAPRAELSNQYFAGVGTAEGVATSATLGKGR
jgi:hypothetical protein